MGRRSRFALGIVMPGRLLEAGPERAKAIRERLRRSCDRVLVYAYGDWLVTRPAELDRPGRTHPVGQPRDERVALAIVSTSPAEEVQHDT